MEHPLPSSNGRRSRATAQRTASLLLLALAWGLLLYRLDRVPPGFQHDQMFNSMDALQVVHGRYPLYFPANFGRGPLFMYTAAGTFALTGGHYLWSLRFTSALWAMLGLAATISLGRRYLPGYAALFTGALMAGSFWFLLAGRLGQESIALFTLTTLMLISLDRANVSLSRRHFAVSGLAGGLALYSYLASRALLVLVPLLILYEGSSALMHRIRRQPLPAAFGRRAAGLALSFAVMLLVGGPLLLYLGTHAGSADGRLGELAGPLTAALEGDLRPVLGDGLETVLAVLWAGPGSLPYHYNLPGRPLLQPPWALLLLIGLVVTLARWQHRREALLLAALLVGLSPSLLTGADALYMRGALVMAPIFILAGCGLEMVAQAIRGWPRWGRSLAAVALASLLVWHFAESGDAYFVQWARAELTQRIYNADYRAAAAYLDDHPANAEVFFGSDRLMDLDARTYELYEPESRAVGWFRAAENPPLPAGDSALYIFPGSVDALPPALRLLSEALHEAFTIPARWGDYTLIRGYRLASAEVEPILDQAGVQPLGQPLTFGGAVRLDAAGVRDHGSYVELVTRWTALAPWPRRLPPKLAVSVVDGSGYRWAQADTLTSLPHETWLVGRSYLEITRVPLPGDVLPGEYDVQVVIYDDSGQIIDVQQSGRRLAAAATVAQAVLEPGLARGDAPSPPMPLAAQAHGHALQPLGLWELPGVFLDGVPVDLHVSWLAAQPVRLSGWRFTLQALNPNGVLLWQQEAEPVASLHCEWASGQVYRLTHRLLPEVDAPGARRAQLRLCAGRAGETPACAELGMVQVAKYAPLTSLDRSPQHFSEARWSNVLSLAGYDLIWESDALRFTLYWRVDSTPPSALKRFVHAVDASGQIVAQADATPENGGIPITLWRQGEYVVDEVSLEPSSAAVEILYVGWYHSESGERLPVVLNSGGEPLPDARLPIATH